MTTHRPKERDTRDTNFNTPTWLAKHWALNILQNQLVTEERYESDEHKKDLQRAKAKLIERMLRRLEDEGMLLGGNVQPSPIEALLER